MNTQAEKTTRRGEVGRGRRTPSQLWQAPLFCIGLLALTLVAASTPLRQDPALRQFREELAQLRDNLVPGRVLPEELVAQADKILKELELEHFTRLGSEAYFLTGSAYFRLAESQASPESQVARTRAVELFDKAMGYQCAERDWPALQYRLGLCLYRLERDRERALDLMNRAVDQGADQPADGYGILVQAYLQAPQPNLEAALAANQKQLEHISDPRGLALMRARLVRAEILMRREQRLDALRELDRIGADAPAEVRLPARQLQIRCAEEEGQWRRALEWWKQLLPNAEAVPGGKARILLAIGNCHANDTPHDAVKAEQAWQEAVSLGGPEGQAAAWRLGEMRLQAEPGRAIEWWTQALSSVHSPNDFQNPYVEIRQIREALEQACHQLLERGDFEQIRQMTELYKRLALAGRAEECLAQASEAHAKLLGEKAAASQGEQAKTLREQSHASYHRAAVAYEQAAALRNDSSAADDLWRGGHCYLQAQDTAKAIGVLEQFVRRETKESRLAEGWFTLAEAYDKQTRPDQAYNAYYKCIEYPSSPLAYRSRYQIALREIEKKNFDQARAILQQILSGTAQVERDTKEKALYKMAGLLLQMQILDQAAWYLKEATRQYPGNPSVLAARDQLGNCYRKLAEQAERKLEEMERATPGGNLTEERRNALEEKRRHYRQTRRQWLEQALQSYQELKDELEETARQRPLNPTETGYMRKALFLLADLRFDLNQFPEALERYQQLQARYRGQVEGLVACYKIWGCVGTMVQTPEARRLAVEAAKKAVNEALADLERLPADHPGFSGGPDIWTKALWESELRRIQQELQRLNTAARPGPATFP
jgi:hypothetical protein